MEIHRLKPMKSDYSPELFNRLYKETSNLRKSLARQIDSRRYGVTPDIVESWFDDKFIFVFNKHFDNKDQDVLKGFIINSLKTFKYRILRKAYGQEGEFYNSTVDLEGDNELINIIPSKDNSSDVKEIFYSLALSFMEKQLSDNAYLLLQVQLNPPPYIIERINNYNSRIPNNLLCEYLGLDLGSKRKTDRYIKKLKKEIKDTTELAQEFFKGKDPLSNFSLS
ncbi:MAG: hypothetical protein CL596_04910 [Alteromonas sp.]|nr:hypothetical protein [Alteromonas sp.]|tara:strand:- start:23363 stop:24031 length:669 start_codon:yes stop_codon:yes gene_type:complete